MLDALAIAQLCMNIVASDPQYDKACNKALEATSAQTGTSQNITLFENKTKEIIEQKTGPQVFVIGGIGYMIYKEKKIKYNFRPKDAVIDSIGVDAGLQNNSVSVGWKF